MSRLTHFTDLDEQPEPEYPTVVVDAGSHEWKVGFDSDDGPSEVFAPAAEAAGGIRRGQDALYIRICPWLACSRGCMHVACP